MDSVADAPSIRRLTEDLVAARAAQQTAHDELAVLNRMRAIAEQRAQESNKTVQYLIGQLMQLQYVDGGGDGQRQRAPSPSFSSRPQP